MNKQEINEKLKENGAWCTECHTGEKDRYVKISKAMELIGQLDEPQKPVVPKFVADWIELCKEKADLISCLSGSYEYGVNLYKRITEDEDWLFEADHQELVARAWLYGYEVEKEPLYCIKIGKGYFSGFDETKVTYIIDDAPGALAQRIKYDSKEEAEMDAIQIGGTVKEEETE